VQIRLVFPFSGNICQFFEITKLEGKKKRKKKALVLIYLCWHNTGWLPRVVYKTSYQKIHSVHGWVTTGFQWMITKMYCHMNKMYICRMDVSSQHQPQTTLKIKGCPGRCGYIHSFIHSAKT
jgi:hypothetical protein